METDTFSVVFMADILIINVYIVFTANLKTFDFRFRSNFAAVWLETAVNMSREVWRQEKENCESSCESKCRYEDLWGKHDDYKSQILAAVLETYVTCSEKAEFEPQRPCPISQDIHTLCKDVTKETSQRHCRSSEDRENSVFVYLYVFLLSITQPLINDSASFTKYMVVSLVCSHVDKTVWFLVNRFQFVFG